MAFSQTRHAINAAKCWPRFATRGRICRRPTALGCAAMESSDRRADATDAVLTSSESVVVLAGAQIPAECGTGSRTQQISRKRPYKTLGLQGQKSGLAMTPPGRPFLLITRKEIVRSAK